MNYSRRIATKPVYRRQCLELWLASNSKIYSTALGWRTARLSRTLAALIRPIARAWKHLVRDIVGAAKVYQGGASELLHLTLDEKLKAGAEESLKRLFPRFKEADCRVPYKS